MPNSVKVTTSAAVGVGHGDKIEFLSSSLEVAAAHTIKLVTQWIAYFKISPALTHHGVTLCPTVFTSLLISWISQAAAIPMKSDISFNTVDFNTAVYFGYYLYWKKKKRKRKVFNSVPFSFVTKENYLFQSTLFLTVQLDLPTSSFYKNFSLSDLVSFRWKLMKFRKEIVWNIYPLNNFL